MADIPSALLALRPGASWCLVGEDYSGLEWNDEIQTKPTEQEVNDEIARQESQGKIDDCKATAKKLLSDTDWLELPSVSDASSNLYVANISELIAYRKQIRALAVDPVANPVWPTKPDTIWNKT